MELFDTLLSRKSIRSYTGESIPAVDLQKILEVGNAAPVGKARFSTLHLTVIENQELLKAFEECAAKDHNQPGFRPFYGAPTLITVSTMLDSENSNNVSFSNAAIMAYNMNLAATALGFGSCLIWGVFRAINKNPALVKRLELPEGFIPCCGIIVGKTKENYTPREIDKNRIGVNRIQ
jgi:nitroreductase